jgi:hypothetical protein
VTDDFPAKFFQPRGQPSSEIDMNWEFARPPLIYRIRYLPSELVKEFSADLLRLSSASIRICITALVFMLSVHGLQVNMYLT